VSLPAEVRQTLWEDYLRNQARNTRIYHELALVLQRFRRENIPVIVLKGAYLAEAVYRDVAVRPMVDVDLLIRKADLDRGEAALRKGGYRSDAQSRPFWEAEQYHFVYGQPALGLVIELHWHLLEPVRAAAIDIDQLWNRAQGVRIAGVDTLTLSPEDQVSYLGLHLLKHQFDASLVAFCDVAELLRQSGEQLQWDRIRQRARDWQMQKALYLALWLARYWLGAPVPDEVLDSLRPEGALAATRLAQAKILGREEFPSYVYFARLWGKRPWPQKMATLVERLFLSPASVAIRYGVPAKSLRIYLYYLVRLRDLLRDFGPATWQLLQGDRNLGTQVSRRDALNHWLETP
jgi:hypothetical protein